jgi:hypothetical protein
MRPMPLAGCGGCGRQTSSSAAPGLPRPAGLAKAVSLTAQAIDVAYSENKRRNGLTVLPRSDQQTANFERSYSLLVTLVCAIAIQHDRS